MRRTPGFITFSLYLLAFAGIQGKCKLRDGKAQVFRWTEGSSLHISDGLAGAFVGVSGDQLIIAGGTNYMNQARPWNGGVKTWYDEIYALDKPNGYWRLVGRLGKKIGYGISLNYKGGIICLGGGDSHKNFTDAFTIRYDSNEISFDSLPPLPAPIINSCGVIANDILYVMGGMSDFTSTHASNNFWSLDLSQHPGKRQWQRPGILPGRGRMLSSAGVIGKNVFLLGGVSIVSNAHGPQREYLKDCWMYNPGMGWKRIADLPVPVASAPTPAFSTGNNELYIFGGSDGSNILLTGQLKDDHPGFSPKILKYDADKDSWTVSGSLPVDIKKDSDRDPHSSIYATVNTPTVIWNNRIVIASGESRPGVRSKRILIGEYLYE